MREKVQVQAEWNTNFIMYSLYLPDFLWTGLLLYHHFPERLLLTLSATFFLTFTLIFVTLIYPPGLISHLLLSSTFSYGFIKEWQTDRSSWMSIWGVRGAHPHPSTSLCAVSEPPPASLHHSGSYKWMWHSSSFSHNPLSLLACLPRSDIPQNTVGISHRRFSQDLQYFQSLTCSIMWSFNSVLETYALFPAFGFHQQQWW